MKKLENLQIIKTETFNTTPCDFYNRSSDNEILLTREQLGSALGYSNPRDAIYRIHERHKDRLDKYSMVDKLSTPSGMHEIYLYTTRGIMEVCRWSNKPKANEFMDWCWDIITAYRNNTLVSPTQNNIELTEIKQELAEIKKLLSTQVIDKPSTPHKSWSLRMLPKFKALAASQNISLTKLYGELYKCFQNTYGIDLNTIVDAYCHINNIDSCYTMEAIDHNKEIRELFEDMTNKLLAKYDIHVSNRKYDSIFAL